MFRLKLIRVSLDSASTYGALFDVNNNRLLCDTIEDRVRDTNADGDLLDPGEEKVYGKTAIPYGTYSIEVTYSPHFKRNMVLVKDVPHFTGIRFHWGRDASNSEGCILCGELQEDMTLRNTGMTDKLVDLLLKYGNKGKLEIFS